MENKAVKTIAAFDFDGTITTKDTLFDFAKFAIGWPKFLISVLIFIPTAAKFFGKKISNSEAKEILFALFFKNMSFSKFEEKSNEYKEKINQILNHEAIEKIDWHKEQNHQLIIISASIENWIVPWAISNGFEGVLATKAEVLNGKLTGKFLSKNCHGPEKVARLLADFTNREAFLLYAYGDSSGDKELLEEADFPFFRKFN